MQTKISGDPHDRDPRIRLTKGAPVPPVPPVPREAEGREAEGACRRDAIRRPRCRPCWPARTRAGHCKHYADSTEKTCDYWARRMVLYHNRHDPLDMAEKEIGEFLTRLAVEHNVAVSTQDWSLSALLLL